jgi:hypothetical protein
MAHPVQKPVKSWPIQRKFWKNGSDRKLGKAFAVVHPTDVGVLARVGAWRFL